MIYNNNIDAIVEKATVEIKSAPTLIFVERLRNDYLGPNGIILRSVKSAESLPPAVKEERLTALHKAKVKIERALTKRTKELKMVK